MREAIWLSALLAISAGCDSRVPADGDSSDATTPPSRVQSAVLDSGADPVDVSAREAAFAAAAGARRSSNGFPSASSASSRTHADGVVDEKTGAGAFDLMVIGAMILLIGACGALRGKR